MTDKTRKLVALIRECGYEPHSYSGRFMFGECCVAFDTEAGFTSVIVALVIKAARKRSVVKLLQNARVDSMGLGMVIYFPDAEVGREETL